MDVDEDIACAACTAQCQELFVDTMEAEIVEDGERFDWIQEEVQKEPGIVEAIQKKFDWIEETIQRKNCEAGEGSMPLHHDAACRGARLGARGFSASLPISRRIQPSSWKLRGVTLEARARLRISRRLQPPSWKLRGVMLRAPGPYCPIRAAPP